MGLSIQSNVYSSPSITGLQRPDGSFAVHGSAQGDIPLSVILTLHALALDLLPGSGDGSETAARLAWYLIDKLQLQNFDNTLMDVDTRAVFHALATLYEYDPACIPPTALASAIHFLTTHELRVGGPYINVLETKKRADVDTNISIGRFVHSVGGPFPILLSYIDQAMTKGIDTSRYFTESWPTELQLAKIRHLTGTDLANGARDNSAQKSKLLFHKDPWGSSQSLYGMEALVILRAQQSIIRKADTLPARVKHVHTWKTAHNRLIKQAKTVHSYDPSLHQALQRMLSKIARADRNYEIGLLAIRFARALDNARPPQTVLETLGVANVFNWTAYTIYDDIIDGESNGKLLPVANIALRISLRSFLDAVPDKAFHKLVAATFDTVDAANAWELTHCRLTVQDDVVTIGALPDYNNLHNLYGRSLTHSLPVIGTLAAAGERVDTKVVTAVSDAFKQYLIIRQLSDDLHDWQEDLRAGHASYVVTSILRDARFTSGRHKLTTLMPRLEQVYLQQTLRTIGETILQRGEQAHSLLRSANLTNPTVIDELVEGYEKIAQRILQEHDSVSSFLKLYNP